MPPICIQSEKGYYVVNSYCFNHGCHYSVRLLPRRLRSTFASLLCWLLSNMSALRKVVVSGGC